MNEPSSIFTTLDEAIAALGQTTNPTDRELLHRACMRGLRLVLQQTSERVAALGKAGAP